MRKNVSSVDNQQGSRRISDPSETTRQTPFSEKEIKAYFLGALHDGTFSSNKRFRISQKGTEWLKILKRLLKKILNNLKIKTGKIHNPSKKVDPDYWRLYILSSSKKSFVKKIGSWHPRKIKILRKRMKI